MENLKQEEELQLRGQPTEIEAMVRIRCPECRKGIVYSHGSHMNRLCPNCGIRFEREPGYFSGAIWIAILLATPVALFMMFSLLWFFRDLHPALAGILASLTFVPLIPLTIRFSRSIWMYLDHQMHPQHPHRDPPDSPEPSPQPIPPEEPGVGKEREPAPEENFAMTAPAGTLTEPYNKEIVEV